MKYGMLLWPHANARYREGARRLSENECKLLLKARNVDASISWTQMGGADVLCFSGDFDKTRALEAASLHSLAYLIFEMREDGALAVAGGRKMAELGEDVSGILKYKGKTNEAFTRCLIHFSVCSGAFAQDAELSLIDPMCGRGTTLFEAANLGYDATGADMDTRELDEGARFFKKYLEYHRVKHQMQSASLSIAGERAVRVKKTLYGTAGRFLSFAYADAARACRALGEKRFHGAVFDMPYGVQHAPGGKASFEALLDQTLPALRKSLLPGGAVAFSFNTYTLKPETARQALRRAGFTVMEGRPYEDDAHWV